MKNSLLSWGKALLIALALSSTIALLLGCNGTDWLDCDGDCWITDGDASMYDWGTRKDCEDYAAQQSAKTGDSWWIQSWESWC